MAVKPIPDGHSTVIPYLCVPDVAGLIAFLQKTFDAKEMYRTTLPDGGIMHAHVHIGSSSVMMGQTPPDYKATQGMLYVYVTDVDAVYRRALEAGATSMAEPDDDQFYGDRVAAVKDLAGNQWWIATRKEEVPEDEIVRRAMARAEAQMSTGIMVTLSCLHVLESRQKENLLRVPSCLRAFVVKNSGDGPRYGDI